MTIDFAIPHTSSNNQPVALSSFRGKLVLLVLEGLAQQTQNEDLKRQLQTMAVDRADLAKEVVVVPIAHLAGVPKIAQGMSLGVIRGVATRLKMPIWLDWDGAAYRACDAHVDKSNVLLLDRAGNRLWGWRGPVPKEQQQALLALIEKHLQPEPAPAA